MVVRSRKRDAGGAEGFLFLTLFEREIHMQNDLFLERRRAGTAWRLFRLTASRQAGGGLTKGTEDLVDSTAVAFYRHFVGIRPTRSRR